MSDSKDLMFDELEQELFHDNNDMYILDFGDSKAYYPHKDTAATVMHILRKWEVTYSMTPFVMVPYISMEYGKYESRRLQRLLGNYTYLDTDKDILDFIEKSPVFQGKRKVTTLRAYATEEESRKAYYGTIDVEGLKSVARSFGGCVITVNCPGYDSEVYINRELRNEIDFILSAGGIEHQSVSALKHQPLKGHYEARFLNKYKDVVKYGEDVIYSGGNTKKVLEVLEETGRVEFYTVEVLDE